MAKIIHLKWTELQREIATKAHEGKTLDELVEAGYTKSLVSKVLNAIKSGQKLPENQEPRTENQEPKGGKQEPKPPIQPTSRTDALANAQGLRFVPRVYNVTYTPVMRAAQNAAVEFWEWPKDMTLEDFLDTALHMLFSEHGITLAGYTISDEARKALEKEREAQGAQEAQETKQPQEVVV